ncbi:MAG: CPBP family intramembrane metalloprotease [Bacteroidetes bacterium]|nr:CPBP family intramembrane metalloprotease [Bacteroidota bacterium]
MTTFDKPMTRRQLLLIAIVVEGGLVLLAWGLGAVVGTPAFDQLHLSWAATGFGLLASVPMLGGLVWVVRSQWPPLARFRGTIDEVVTPLFANCTMMDLVVISALAGLGEEVLFRGVMQTALAGAVGLSLAVAFTSIVFGLAHFISVTYAVYATVVGVYLGVLLIVFGNLLAPVVAHAAYDFLALVYLVYFRPPAAGFDPRGTLSEPLA